ncbi:hypothetical protein [Polynucleobacter sp. 39-46-10]|uniref:hypothetical protein n=1 Tax=Polynucleobacter sp. 39-46-10 TaxID=1970428 RepID=UPI000BCA5E1F|nr:hypothetical protein [Polynucleobacter sp. 39-46-10]OZA77870.1 MAG: hypothetical protein B7X71_03485 [Polynucleobacter sp. 39-46-10]
MGDIEFVGRVSPKSLKSWGEQFKEERDQLLADQKRFAKYGTNNPKLAALMASGQLMPAAELVRVREEEVRQAAAFEAAVQSEQSHSRTRIPREKVESAPVFSREPFSE